MSVAALNSPSAIYREEQNFAWWIYALLAVVVLVCGLGLYVVRETQPVVPAVGPRLAPGAFLAAGRGPVPAAERRWRWCLHMTTVVTPSECCVWYGWLPLNRRAIALEQIRRVEIVSYRAIPDHGFWGSHLTRDGERVLTARGDRAVRLHLIDGSRVLIGTQRPEELAGRPGAGATAGRLIGRVGRPFPRR